MSEDLKTIEEALEKNPEGVSRMMGKETTIFLLDCSGSMDQYMHGLVQVKKLEAMRKALVAMLDARINYQTGREDSLDEMALIFFPSISSKRDDYPEVAVHPMKASAAHTAALSRIRTGGGTPLYGAMIEAGKLCDSLSDGMIRLVIVSDGEPTGNSKEECLKKAEDLVEEHGVVIDTIGVGTRATGYYSCYDEGFMIKLAKIGEGEFTPIEDAEKFAQKMIDLEIERRTLMGNGILLLGSGS